MAVSKPFVMQSLLSELGWYANTTLSNYHEVHAAELGIFCGLIVAMIYSGGFEREAYALLVGLLVLSLGIPDLNTVCTATGEQCGSRVIQAKPWYFLSGLLFSKGSLVVVLQFVRSVHTVDRFGPFSDQD